MKTWKKKTVPVCTGCNKPMLPNVSTWDEDGCGWNCTTFGCGDFSGGEIEADDLIALGVKPWIADRIEALSNAVLEMEI